MKKNRDLYLNTLVKFKDVFDHIKVITGVRRCGKSSLLDLFETYLLQQDVGRERIIRMNFELAEFQQIEDWRQLYDYIRGRLDDTQANYVLLDEVQHVEEWERAVISLYAEKVPTDIYITGSNAFLLSSELATYLSGRYVEIKMLPLSFAEYLDFTEPEEIRQQFDSYLRFGGFPSVAQQTDEEVKSFILQSVYDTIILRDIVQRNKIDDQSLLESIFRFLVGNIGNLTSSKKISDYLVSQSRKNASVDVVEEYLKMLEKAYIVYRADRFDLAGKELMAAPGKYYVVDTGFRNILLSSKKTDFGHVIENVVYFELLRRGYRVDIGNLGPLEIDFVASKNQMITYYQVSASILDQATLDRELRPLQEISDNYEKIILSMDRIPEGYNNYNGVKHMNLIDFLLNR